MAVKWLWRRLVRFYAFDRAPRLAITALWASHVVLLTIAGVLAPIPEIIGVWYVGWVGVVAIASTWIDAHWLFPARMRYRRRKPAGLKVRYRDTYVKHDPYGPNAHLNGEY